MAQLLSYAAAMRGLTLSDFNSLVAAHVPEGVDTAVSAVGAADQEGDLDIEAFDSILAKCLSTGRFRLVFVLDSAPTDLVRLVGYLEDMTDAGLAIDLVTGGTVKGWRLTASCSGKREGAASAGFSRHESFPAAVQDVRLPWQLVSPPLGQRVPCGGTNASSNPQAIISIRKPSRSRSPPSWM